MNILVLHKNNVPFCLRSISSFWEDHKISLTSHPLILPPTDIPDYDTFLSEELDKLELSQYDLIVLPYDMSESYMEYTGLRVIAHIRLTPKWNSLTTPVLFLGIDKLEEIVRFTSLGQILFTYSVFKTSKTDKAELLKIFQYIKKYYNKEKLAQKDFIVSSEYKSFIMRMKCIQAPANYTTHHSIANEWAILRWTEMFTWKDNKPLIKNLSIANSLYFKYLLMQVAIVDGKRETFDKKHKKNSPNMPIIPDIKDKRIIYFEDEGEKGWHILLGGIFELSEATMIPFPISKGISKEQLLCRAKIFIDDIVENNPGDCYLIDLRLHDDDFKSDIAPDKLSGIQIAKYIHDKNKGSQIVFFTASNKIWNYEGAVREIGNCAYVIKESPEYNYTRTETELCYRKFCSAIKEAIRKSYISKYIILLNDYRALPAKQWNLLDQFVDMLLFDESGSLKYNVLNLYLFIDSYIDEKFKLEANELVLKTDMGHCCVKYNPLLVLLSKEYTDDEGNVDEECGYKHIRFRDSIHDTYNSKKEETLDIKQDSELPVVIVALHYYYKISTELCNQVLKLRTERNRHIAHHGGETSLTLSDLKRIFESIITPILKKDYSN